ncbi:MAG: mechanosensitive ion channel family protein [Eubacteriales bacterium]|nr:mechanosensitive ion channel family protein [Eubacteriales bacterium]
MQTGLSAGKRIAFNAATIISLIVILILSAYFISMRFYSDLEEKERELSITINAIEKRYDYSKQLFVSDIETLKGLIVTEENLQLLNLRNTPRASWQYSLDDFTSDDDNVEYYIYQNGVCTLHSSNARGIALNDDSFNSLLSNMSVCYDEVTADMFYAMPINGIAGESNTEYLVTMYREANGSELTAMDERNVFSLTQTVTDGGGIIIYNNKNGNILSSTTEEWIGMDITEVSKNNIHNVLSAELTSYSVPYILRNLNGTRALRAELDNDISIVVYMRLDKCFHECIYNIIIPIGFFILCSILLLSCARLTCLIRNQMRREDELIKLGKDIWLDKVCAKKIISLFLACLICLITITGYISVLNDLSRENIDSDMNLSNIIKEEANNNDIRTYFEDSRNFDSVLTFRKVVSMLDSNELLASNEHLASINNICGTDEITIFDQNGVSIASSSGFVGYNLIHNADESQDENRAWAILTTNTSEDIFLSDSDAYEYCYVSKLKSADQGVICIYYTNRVFEELTESLSPQNLILESDFGDSDIIYYSPLTPDVLYLAAAGDKGGSETLVIDNTLDASQLYDGYFGMVKLNDTKYYINIKADDNEGSEDTFFISAHNMNHVSGRIFFMIRFIAHGICIVCVLLLFLFVPCHIDDRNLLKNQRQDDFDPKTGSLDNAEADYVAGGSAEMISDSLGDEQSNDSILRREKLQKLKLSNELINRHFTVLMWLIGVACIASFIIFLFLESFEDVNNHSLVKYLLHYPWQRGLNLFSITMILILVTLIWFSGYIICRLVKLILESLGPKWQTIGRLLISAIQFACLIASILIVLSELGVNTRTIVASAGLTSAIIGFGAQKTFENVFSGLFTIFEGNFRVGDIVSINGWTGMIKSIGIRTTCIESFGYFNDYKNTRVINNSMLTDITNLSRSPSMACALIPVPYEADFDFIEDLFNKNEAIISAKIPEATEGPFYDGIVILEDSAKIIRYRVKCNESNRTFLERRLMQLAVQLLESNGISIPFNQLVLHNGDIDLPVNVKGDNGIDKNRDK